MWVLPRDKCKATTGAFCFRIPPCTIVYQQQQGIVRLIDFIKIIHPNSGQFLKNTVTASKTSRDPGKADVNACALLSSIVKQDCNKDTVTIKSFYESQQFHINGFNDELGEDGTDLKLKSKFSWVELHLEQKVHIGSICHKKGLILKYLNLVDKILKAWIRLQISNYLWFLTYLTKLLLRGIFVSKNTECLERCRYQNSYFARRSSLRSTIARESGICGSLQCKRYAWFRLIPQQRGQDYQKLLLLKKFAGIRI